MNRARSTGGRAGLRVPVPMVDWLLQIAAVAIVFMGLSPTRLASRDVDLPQAQPQPSEETKLLPATPRLERGVWSYELPDGEVLDAAHLVERSRGRTVVLLVPAATSLQQFLRMQEPLHQYAIHTAIAVRPPTNGDTP